MVKSLEKLKNIIVTTTNEVPGFKIKEYKGVVWASSVKGRHFLSDLNAIVKSFFGLRVKEHENLMNSLKMETFRKLNQGAKKLGANAVVGLRIEVTYLSGAVEIFAYGTAVVVG